MSNPSQSGEGVEVIHDTANSHCFDDQIMVAGECIAFASEPWSSKIAVSLARDPAADVGRDRERIAAIISPTAMKSLDTIRAEWEEWVKGANFGDGPNQPVKPKLIDGLVRDEWEELQPKRLRILAKADKILAILSRPTPSSDPAAAGKVERLREAAKPFAAHWQSWMGDREYHKDDDEMSCFASVTFGQLRDLRAALEPSDKGVGR